MKRERRPDGDNLVVTLSQRTVSIMVQTGKPVKPFPYAPAEVRKAKIRYLLALRGTNLKGLHKLLACNPSYQFMARVAEGERKSATLETRIAGALGVTRDQLFGGESLEIWRVA